MLARLFGLRLLRLTGTVVLTPVVAQSEPPVVRGEAASEPRQERAATRAELPVGSLADAEALLRQATATLEAGRDSSSDRG